MSMGERQNIERQIARSAVNALIKAGYSVAVFDGEEIALEAARDIGAIMDAMFSTDEDCLFAMITMKDGKKKRVGWVSFVYGNAGYDVISDYTTNLETVLADTTALTERLEMQRG
ncbi:hypothetical protein [Nitrosomonas eutropha]|jgi:uncharacterized protein YrrD|uniref:Uncharacterized protein n=2 Tax=Nitrosomonas eutropha TaxID=916 RepID=A0ABX5M6I9_9PROT|nr:hypothetical protein [Nitrosomonas eutropha]ABI60827.1 hypothetical protein Neut_2625 [Nitrosomonas eutropha C91]PXV79084.1 hypothetical protein C8R14_12519 [Nitrosomonas eutropha]